MATKKKVDKKKTVKKKGKALSAGTIARLAASAPEPELPKVNSTNPSLMYGVVAHNFTDDRRAYVDGSPWLAAYRVGEYTVVAIKCIQHISDSVFTRDVGWDPECLRELREFCKKCKVKFQAQWIFAWLD